MLLAASLAHLYLEADQLSCAIDVALIVLEPTGGLADLLAETGFDVAVVNARQIRDYARAIGRLAKTDKLDAEVIALFAEGVQPSQRHMADHQRASLAELVSRDCHGNNEMVIGYDGS